MKTEELNKMTTKKLIALYEELTGEPITFRVKRKEDIVGAIKSYIRAKSRGAAFSKYA
jgi:hypothetical protein